MTGNWAHHPASTLIKTIPHARIWFKFPKSQLIYVDQRNFGSLKIVTSQEADEKFQKIGWDLLKNTMITPSWQAIQTSKTHQLKPVGQLLMDQKIASGIGNIYKAEILYRAGINPAKLIKNIQMPDWDNINKLAHSILISSYKYGGSSVQNYKAGFQKGTYQHQLQIYKKKCCPKGHATNTIKQKDRTTWFCPTCQP